MAITIIKGSVLTVDQGIICHQANCMGKMGAGIALQIRQKWPIVYEDYMNAYNSRHLVLGAVIFSTIVVNQLYVASICGQNYYGRGKRYTEYPAVRVGLDTVSIFAKGMSLPVFIPQGMGCSLAGGDWNIVFGIVEETLPNATIMDYN